MATTTTRTINNNSRAVDLNRNQSKRGGLNKTHHVDNNNNRNNYKDRTAATAVNESRSNGEQQHTKGSGSTSNNNGSGGGEAALSKAQKNKTSLVREGYSPQGLQTKQRPRPKAKVPPTQRNNTSRLESNQAGPATNYTRGQENRHRPNGALDNSNINPAVNEHGSFSEQDGNSTGRLEVASNGQGYQPARRDVKAGNKAQTAAVDHPSVRQRFYETADMDDVVQDKVATQLRENGVAETKIAFLSSRIAQAVRDDVVGERRGTDPVVVRNLSSVVNDHLDAILHNYPSHTDLSHLRPNDAAAELSHMVLSRLAQVHEELQACISSLEPALQSSRRQKQTDKTANGAITSTGADDTAVVSSPREQHTERSVVMAIKEGIDQQKTEKDIAEDRLMRLRKGLEEVDQLKQSHTQDKQIWDDENVQLKKYLTEADQDNETLVNKVKEQQQEQDKMTRQLQTCRKEIQTLKRQIEDLTSHGHMSLKEMAALQSDKARLQVLCDQKQKEILHLRDPDRDLLYQIRTLKEDLTSFKTQTRRLTEEKGLLKAKTQKLEAALEESLKDRNKLTVERDALFKESQDIRQKYRKLSLATPVQRSLPEIMTPRSRSIMSRGTTLINSRTNSSVDSHHLAVKHTTPHDSSNRLTTHEEMPVEEEHSR